MTEPPRRVQIALYETAARQVVPAVRGGATTTVRLKGPRPVTVVELSGPAFPPGAALPSLAAIEPLALAFEAEGDGPAIVVAGHGEDPALARRRAEAVVALLVGEPARWLQVAVEAGTAEDWARVLDGVHAARGWRCAASGGEDATRAFRDAFLVEHGGPVAAGPGPAAGDWHAAFVCWRALLGRRLVCDEGALRARAAAWTLVSPGGVSCAGHWPPARCRVPGHQPAAAERVDILRFAAEHAPVLACHGPEGCAPEACDVYRKAKYRARKPEALPTFVEFLVVGPDGAPVEGLPYEVVCPDGRRERGVLPADGRVRVDGLQAAGAAHLRLALGDAWSPGGDPTAADDDPGDGPAPDVVEVVAAPGEGVDPAGLAFTAVLADGSRRAAALDARGRARLVDVPPGEVRLVFDLPDDVSIPRAEEAARGDA